MSPPLVVIWLMGLLACALYFLVMHLRCSKVYRTSLPLENDFVRQWLREHRTWRTVQIRQSDVITAPLTYGIWRPMVLMPKMTDWEDIDCLRYILAHEFVHIKRLTSCSNGCWQLPCASIGSILWSGSCTYSPTEIWNYLAMK